MIMGMRFEIVTIFPRLFDGVFEHGIVRRAIKDELVTIGLHDLREHTHDRHRTVDDRPFGGGEGMVLKPEPLAEALGALGIRTKMERSSSIPTLGAEVRAKDGAPAPESMADTRVILMSAQGRRFDQSIARELAKLD